nr:MAG TPA: hypothetical protein [Caudoviricetes sp.]
MNPYDIIKVQSDEDKNHHDCHDVNLHGLNVSFLISMLLDQVLSWSFLFIFAQNP